MNQFNRTFYASTSPPVDYAIGSWSMSPAEDTPLDPSSGPVSYGGITINTMPSWIIRFFLDCSGGVGNMFENGDEIALSWVLNGLDGPTGMTGMTGMTGPAGPGAILPNAMRAVINTYPTSQFGTWDTPSTGSSSGWTGGEYQFISFGSPNLGHFDCTRTDIKYFNIADTDGSGNVYTTQLGSGSYAMEDPSGNEILKDGDMMCIERASNGYPNHYVILGGTEYVIPAGSSPAISIGITSTTQRFWIEGKGTLSGLIRIRRVPWYPEEYIVPNITTTQTIHSNFDISKNDWIMRLGGTNGVSTNRTWIESLYNDYPGIKLNGPLELNQWGRMEPGLRVVDSNQSGDVSILIESTHTQSGPIGGEAYTEYRTGHPDLSANYSWRTGINEGSEFLINYAPINNGIWGDDVVSAGTDYDSLLSTIKLDICGNMSVWRDLSDNILGDISCNNMFIENKLTVGGLIDPTGLVLSNQSTQPYTPIGMYDPTGGTSLIYSDVSGHIIFVDSSGSNINLTNEIAGMQGLWGLIQTNANNIGFNDIDITDLSNNRLYNTTDTMTGKLTMTATTGTISNGVIDISSNLPLQPGLRIYSSASGGNKASILLYANDTSANVLQGEAFIDFRTALGSNSLNGSAAYDGYVWRIGQNDNTNGLLICQQDIVSHPSSWYTDTVRAAMRFDPSGVLAIYNDWDISENKWGGLKTGDISANVRLYAKELITDISGIRSMDASSNLGDYSVALGNHDTAASGNYAFAFGGDDNALAPTNRAMATGDYAFAFGKQSRATGLHSVAIGEIASASNTSAVALGGAMTKAEGFNSFAAVGGNASGSNSIALGVDQGLSNATASGQNSIAIGGNAQSTGTNTIAIGIDCSAVRQVGNANTGHGAIAMGWKSVAAAEDHGYFNPSHQDAKDGAMAFGVDCSSTGLVSLAMGKRCDASGNYSISLGYGGLLGTSNLASGNESIAIGTTNNALAHKSACIGWYNNVVHDASYAIAIGHDAMVGAGAQWGMALGKGKAWATNSFAAQSSKAYGVGSTTFGNSQAEGKYAFAANYEADASGSYSNAFGTGTVAQYRSSTTIGQYNIPEIIAPVDASDNFYPTNKAFIIGGGLSPSDKRNIFTVDFSGKTDISGVSGEAIFDVSNACYFVLKDKSRPCENISKCI